MKLKLLGALMALVPFGILWGGAYLMRGIELYKVWYGFPLQITHAFLIIASILLAVAINVIAWDLG